MRALIVVLFFGSLLQASASDEGLFVPVPDAQESIEVVDGHFVSKSPAKRIAVKRVWLRHDTEDTKKFWLEMHVGQARLDPGDWYYFRAGGKMHHGFKYRGHSDEEEWTIWALGFSDVDSGRALMKQVKRIYKLTGDKVEDRTKENKSE